MIRFGKIREALKPVGKIDQMADFERCPQFSILEAPSQDGSNYQFFIFHLKADP